ncbi:MAG: hypothetical protein RID91_13870 [Azospirillaceae bacterium]
MDPHVDEGAPRAEAPDAGRAAQAMDDLAAALESETEALAARRYDGLDHSAARKETLLEACQRETEGFAAPDVMDRLDPTVGAALRRAADRLRKASRDNAQALIVNRDASRRVVDMIVETAREAQQGPSSYTAHGRQGSGRRDAAVSLRLNQTL